MLRDFSVTYLTLIVRYESNMKIILIVELNHLGLRLNLTCIALVRICLFM